MAKIARTCERCQTTFGAYESKGHTRCIPCRKAKRPKGDYPCTDCGAAIHRGLRCRSCAEQRERSRELRRRGARNRSDRVRPHVLHPTVAQKVCAGCGERKAAIAFQRCRTHNDGLKAKCKACVAPERAREFQERKNDPERLLRYKLRKRLSDRDRRIAYKIRQAIRVDRRASLGRLGYTTDDLRLHLERQFTRGMTWKAFMEGRIHIDHRVPLVAFNLEDEDEFKAAWAITNLQPLWAEDNVRKGARREVLL